MTEQISFNKALFEVCPTGMLAMDQDTCIRWLNPALEQMLNLSGDELIGKDKNTLPEELHALFDDTDVLHLSVSDRGERWLQRDVRTVENGNQRSLQLHFYQDISNQIISQMESDLLRKQVDELTITDDLTGLANRRALEQALAVQVTRSRRYGNPLILGAAHISLPNMTADGLSDDTVLTFSHYLRERLRWADTIGRYADDTFLLVMPETSLDDAIKLLKQIEVECKEGALQGLEAGDYPHIKVSASAWEKGDDPQRLMNRTLAALLGAR
ncbi:MAG: diguanylate cyclase [Gammaproteobacteria bacterium]|nr:diguanylate cyclase [Gammaproteobacteria bacterium]